MRPACPRCNSRNTRQHSDNRISEHLQLAQTSHRCDRCKKYFYMLFPLGEPQILFHKGFGWQWADGTRSEQLNPNRFEGPDFTEERTNLW